MTSSPRLLIRSISPDKAPRSGSSARRVVVPGPIVTSQSSNSARSVVPACPKKVISNVWDCTGYRLPVFSLIRISSVPGDRIHLVNKRLFLNGHPVDEPYVYHKSAYIDAYRDDFPSAPGVGMAPGAQDMLANHVVNGDVAVPPWYYFAMGDNRDNSLDSRYWGFVPRANIIGKPLIIYWSYDAPTSALANATIGVDHIIDLAQHFFTKTRWNRTFNLIHGYPVQ